MPTYVYACDTCGKQFEQFQSMKDDALTVCVCGQEGAVRRVVQPVGIVFKGSGWYITDSRKGDSALLPAIPPKILPARAAATAPQRRIRATAVQRAALPARAPVARAHQQQHLRAAAIRRNRRRKRESGSYRSLTNQ